MSVGTKILAGVLLGIGLPIALLTGGQLANPNATGAQKQGAWAGLLTLGLPPAAAGGWLIVRSRRLQEEERDRLRAAFFRLVQEGNGHLTLLKFAMETGLDGDAARVYLDDRAREFNAGYNVSEEGKISYYFDAEMAPPALAAAPDAATYDVVLESIIPAGKWRVVIRELRDIRQCSWGEAKEIARRTPASVLQGVDRATAERCRERLEKIGAIVLIVLN